MSSKDARRKENRRLARAFNHSDPKVDLAQVRSIAIELEADHSDAPTSLREGLADMFTVRLPGFTGPLARSLMTTNAIESMLSVARTAMGNVKRWRVDKDAGLVVLQLRVPMHR